MGAVYFTAAADTNRANAANWSSTTPGFTALGRVPAAGDAAVMNAASSDGDLVCDSVNTNGFNFKAFTAPSTITAPSVSVGQIAAAGEVIGGNTGATPVTFTGDVAGIDGQTTSAAILSHAVVLGNTSGYLSYASAVVNGTMNSPGTTSSVLTGSMSLHDSIFNGACTIAVVASGNNSNEYNTFMSTVTMTLAAGTVCYHSVFNAAASITGATTSSITYNTFNSAANLTITAPATANNNTFNGSSTFTIGSFVVRAGGAFSGGVWI